MALPFINSRVPVSGQTSTQLPHPMQSDALITGCGFPEGAPEDAAFTPDRWTVHIASAAPQ
jgi:hypothetical protein